MRVAAFIFFLTGLCGLVWMTQQVISGGFHIGAAFSMLVPIALLFQGWQLWGDRPNAWKSGIATAVILSAGCVAQLCMIAWVAELPVTVLEDSPLRAALVSLWSGVILYSIAAISLVIRSRRRQHSRTGEPQR